MYIGGRTKFSSHRENRHDLFVRRYRQGSCSHSRLALTVVSFITYELLLALVLRQSEFRCAIASMDRALSYGMSFWQSCCANCRPQLRLLARSSSMRVLLLTEVYLKFQSRTGSGSAKAIIDCANLTSVTITGTSPKTERSFGNAIATAVAVSANWIVDVGAIQQLPLYNHQLQRRKQFCFWCSKHHDCIYRLCPRICTISANHWRYRNLQKQEYQHRVFSLHCCHIEPDPQVCLIQTFLMHLGNR